MADDSSKAVSINPSSVSTGNDKPTPDTPTPDSSASPTAPASPTTTPASTPAAPASPSTAPVSVEPPTQPSREQLITNAVKRDFVKVETLVDSFFSHVGKCAKCGWQTMQHDASAAEQLTIGHALQHWKEVTSKL